MDNGNRKTELSIREIYAGEKLPLLFYFSPNLNKTIELDLKNLPLLFLLVLIHITLTEPCSVYCDLPLMQTHTCLSHLSRLIAVS